LFLFFSRFLQPRYLHSFPTRRSSDLTAAMLHPTVWIPASTRPEHRAFLPHGIDIREVPAAGNLDDPPQHADILIAGFEYARTVEDRKSTRLNSSHLVISYAVFCLKKK